MVAQDVRFGSWDALMRALVTGDAPLAGHAVDLPENSIAPRRRLRDAEWDALLAEVKEKRITRLDAGGLMTDAVMARLAELDHVTSLSLGDSRELSDDGLRHLARMPQLQPLAREGHHLGGIFASPPDAQCLTRITDRSLEILGGMEALEQVEFCECNGVTNAGVRFLTKRPRLREVARDSLPGVTLEGTKVFPPRVRVRYSTSTSDSARELRSARRRGLSAWPHRPQ